MYTKHFTSKKLVCFDFDGLLVDSEPVHHQSYMETLESLGFPFPLDFKRYCEIAHSANRMLFKEKVHEKYPDFPYTWEELRAKKTQRYRELLKEGRVKAMQGAEKLIEKLLSEDKEICIVTNSDRCDVDEIISHIPFLQKIPKIIAREDYENPKPKPDGYLKALEFYKVQANEAIGLEDSRKGLGALKEALMDALFINPHIDEEKEGQYFSLDSVNS